MGVPKFYRWVSERYPCLSEVVKEFQIPEFDNLYLDMNGIIHVCSHPEDDNPHFRITEEKIFSDIMHYLEFLFRMIKPRKVFFMAVDGVAPRAKMNQQRGRRFRSAREAEDLEKKAMMKGETLPTEKRFDSNCITPGTPFMVRLQEQLKYFVVKKISHDPLWQGVRVFLSGHETPGEGEHKIMDFIRAEKSQPNYDPNTRHCLYGLDADLMMLGLASHEPHFSLLREEVRFGGKTKDKRQQSKRPVTPEETTFHLLHLSLFREYLDFEFSELRNKDMTFEFDLEQVIDDWVLMGFLVGNDFIPHLPNLHINHDALPLLWRTYIEVLPSCGGYINNGGKLNFERFEKYLAALSKFDFETFSDQVGDLKWLESKKAGAGAEKKELLSAARKLAKNQKKTVASMSKNNNQFAMLDKLDSDDIDVEELGTELLPSPEDLSEEFELSDEFSDEDTLDDEFRHHKRHYYMEKMDYEKVTPEVLRDQAEGYVRGIQWILLYYYEGVPSWSWYYPHHYAPYMSDVRDFKDMVIQFDKGTPFLPFQQLMAVLPAASKELLPPAYQTLMTDTGSPVVDFYPVKFDTDLNGKQQDWEAVVLIPFIDENRLLSAIESREHNLTRDEKSRNRHGPHLLYEWTEEVGEEYRSPLPGAFPDIVLNHARLTEVHQNAHHLPSEQLIKGLLPGARLDVFFPGFPTLKHIKHTAELSKEGVKVFQMNSRGFNVMLHITQDYEPPYLEHIAKEYLGKEIFVAWPHLYEAKVIEVSDDDYSYSLKEESSKGKSSNYEFVRKKSDKTKTDIWMKEVATIAERYKDRLGIIIGETTILIRALPMTGRRYLFGSHGRITMEKQFGTLPVAYAHQATVKDIAVQDKSFCQFTTLADYLPQGCNVFMLAWPYYGCKGEVLDTDTETGRVRINLSILEEPELQKVISCQEQYNIQYVPSFVAAQKVAISGHLLSRLTGNIYVYAGKSELAREQANPHKVNVGLNLKFSKSQHEVPGFTKLVEGHWAYSYKCVDEIREYLKRFPELVDALAKENKGNDMYYESEIFPETCGYNLKTVEEYIKSLPCSSIKSVKAGADIISEGVIQALQDQTDKAVEVNKKKEKVVKMKIKPHLLFRPMVKSSSLIPDSTATYELFDRVVNCRQGFSVPFGLRGTVVGIHPAEVEVNTMYEVIFDENFAGGINIRNSSNRGYRMPPSSLLNLSHGQRKNGKLTPVELAAQQQQTQKQGNQSNSYSSMVRNQSRYNQGQYGQGQYNQGQYSQGQYTQVQGQYNQGQFHKGQGQHQYGLYQKNQGASNSNSQNWRSDNTNQSNINMRPAGSSTQFNTQQNNPTQLLTKPNESTENKVFNGALPGDRSPKFVTPKVTQHQQPQRRPSQGESKVTSSATNTVTNREFENTWKQLQASFQATPPTDNTTNKGTTLSQAASVLPTIPSPECSPIIDSITTKIDVQSLFNQALNSADLNSEPKPVPVDSATSEDVEKLEEIVLEKAQGKTQETTQNKMWKTPVCAVVTNDEFTAMCQALEDTHLKEDNEPAEDKQEDSTLLIKKMLKIKETPDEKIEDDITPVPDSSNNAEPNKSYGRQVSIQELFAGVKIQQPEDDKSATATAPSSQQHQQQYTSQQQQYQQQSKGRGQGDSRQFRGQGQTPGHFQGNQPQGQNFGNQGQSQGQGQTYSNQEKSQGYQQQQYKGGNVNTTGRPNLMIPSSRGGNRNPVMELMGFCQALQLGLPKYDYHIKNGCHICEVICNRFRFYGSQCPSKEEAAESAASVALLHLKGGMPQLPAHPMMQVPPGYVAYQYRPQGRQFSSPNSAFSPVNALTGLIPGQQQNQSPQLYAQGYQQQRPFYNQGQGQMYQPPNTNRNTNPRQPTNQQQPSKVPVNNPASQVTDNKIEEKPVANAPANLKMITTKDGMTQPTCVVNPFVPLQVTRKQTSQKTQRDSVPEDGGGGAKINEAKTDTLTGVHVISQICTHVDNINRANSEHHVANSELNVTNSELNVANSELNVANLEQKPVAAQSATSANSNVITPDNSTSNETALSQGASRSRETTQSRETAQGKAESRETTPGKEKTSPSKPVSTKKRRRRLAANFGDNN